MYISGVRAYNIDDLLQTGRIDLPGMEKVVYIVCTCTCKLNNNNIFIIANCNNSKLQLGGFFVTFFSA